jgi:hypothetical protein
LRETQLGLGTGLGMTATEKAGPIAFNRLIHVMGYIVSGFGWTYGVTGYGKGYCQS